MSDQHRLGGRSRLSALLAGLACLVRDRVVDPMRRGARSRAGERELARLDDRLLRDIGLMRSQVHAAAYGRVGPGVLSRAELHASAAIGIWGRRAPEALRHRVARRRGAATPLARRAARS